MDRIKNKKQDVLCRLCGFHSSFVIDVGSHSVPEVCPRCFQKNSMVVANAGYICPTCSGSVKVLMTHRARHAAICKCERCRGASEVVVEEEEVV